MSTCVLGNHARGGLAACLAWGGRVPLWAGWAVLAVQPGGCLTAIKASQLACFGFKPVLSGGKWVLPWPVYPISSRIARPERASPRRLPVN